MIPPDVPSGHVLLRAPFTGDELLMLLDQAPPTPSGGFGGWQSVDIPRDRPVRYWGSAPEEGLEVAVVLLKGEETVTAQLRTLRAIGASDGPTRPRQVEIFGQLPPLPIDRWVIDDVTFGDALYTAGNRIVEQRLTIKLGEPPDADGVSVRGGGRSRYRTRNGKRAKRPTAALLQGETLQEFAARTLGNPSRWNEIAKLQKPPIKNPRKPGKAGRRLRLPSG